MLSFIGNLFLCAFLLFQHVQIASVELRLTHGVFLIGDFDVDFDRSGPLALTYAGTRFGARRFRF